MNHAKVIWDSHHKPKGIFGGHLNIRSLIGKSDQVHTLLSESNLDYLCLSETWLHLNTPTAMINIPGYACFRNDRSTDKGGGVLIYIRETLKYHVVHLDTPFECLALIVELSPRSKFNIVVLYNSPSHNVSFYVDLQNLLKTFDSRTETVVYGDFNINWLDKKAKIKLKTIMAKFNFQQLVKTPTRITGTSKTLIDHLFTNRPERITKMFNLITGLSDHNMILAVRKLSKKRLLTYTGKAQFDMKMGIPKSNMRQLESDLGDVNWDSTLLMNDVNMLCNLTTRTLSSLIEKYTVRMKCSARKSRLPWLDSGMFSLMKKRDLALKKGLTSGLQTDLLVFKGLRNKVTSGLRKAKASYYSQLIERAKGNSASLWKHLNKLTNKEPKHDRIKELMINGQPSTDAALIACEFNNFFIDSVEELAKTFGPTIVTSSDKVEDLPNSFFIREVDESKIEKILQKLSASKAKDVYSINTAFIKQHSAIIIKPLTRLVNLSITSSQFPDLWKKSVVTPIFKSGDKNQVSNYRPISILPALSKVLEKVVTEQLVEHLESNQLLHPEQFGFRHKHSTESANCYFVDTVKRHLDEGNVVGAVFLDLKKAFDTVCHNTLLSKLSKFNFSDQAHTWMSSYLESREQCVQIDSKMSASRLNKTGLPQGSILGPVLFTLFINDLPESCLGGSIGCQLYADDTVIYSPAKTPGGSAESLTLAMDKVNEWLSLNRLTLNMKKTVSMCFSIRAHPAQLRVLSQGQEVEVVDECKFLGVILDPRLKFDKHVKMVCKSVRTNLNCFRLIRHCIPLEAAQLYLHGMIFSKLSYCVTVWSQAPPTVMLPLTILYKQAIKIMAKRDMRWHYCNILKNCNLLSFENFVKFSTLKLVFKCLHGLAPGVLCGCISRCNNSRVTRGTVSGNCKVAHRRTTFGQTAFSIKGSNLWNALPVNVKQSPNLRSFNKAIKVWLKVNQSCTHF